jgi:hypothetical protein
MFRRRKSPDKLTVELAHTLGYATYPKDLFAQPHIDYILQSYTIGHSQEDYVRLIVHVVNHFLPNKLSTSGKPDSRTIQALLDGLENNGFRGVFTSTDDGSPDRKDSVEDHVMCILGRWTMMLEHFQLRSDTRKVIAEYSRHTSNSTATAAYTESLSGLIEGSEMLLPNRSHIQLHYEGIQDEAVQTALSLVRLLSDLNGAKLGASRGGGSLHSSGFLTPSAPRLQDSTFDNYLESQSVKSIDLNAFTLSADAAVSIIWTFDLSRHMVLSKRDGRHLVEIFAMPCMFSADHCTSDVMGISSELAQEIKWSYAMLFNAWYKLPHFARFGQIFGLRKVCWCWSCSAFRFQRDEIVDYENWWKNEGNLPSTADPELSKLIKTKPLPDWNQSSFPNLWPRIQLLQQHQRTTRPWSIWMLFRDRRDTLQYWTFL